jgi:hypothetical protein
MDASMVGQLYWHPRHTRQRWTSPQGSSAVSITVLSADPHEGQFTIHPHMSKWTPAQGAAVGVLSAVTLRHAPTPGKDDTTVPDRRHHTSN